MNGTRGHDERPRVSFKRFLAQLVLGTIGGFISGLLGFFIAAVIGANVAPNYEFAGNRGYEASGGIGWLIGVVFGTPTLVYAFTRRRDGTGAYLPTLAGSVVAAVLVSSIILVSPQLRLDTSVIPVIALTALGATSGYNSTHRLWQVVGYAAVGVVLIVAGWGYTLYR